MKLLLTGLLLAAVPLTSRAETKLPDIFSDHAVLQRSARTDLWGTATAGETLTVTLGGLPPRQVVADGQGKWQVALDLSHAPDGPADLTVKGSGAPVVSHDVVVGEVWLCSGQSNMEFKMSGTIGGPEEIARSADPGLRCFTPKRQAVFAPAENLPGKWVVAGPATTGGISGVAYYFAKKVEASQHVPVGLVDTSWGGTPAEAWVSSEGLDHDPALKARKDALLAEAPQTLEKLKHFAADFQSWAARFHREEPPAGDPDAFAGPEVSTADWKTVTLPGELAAAGLPDAGVVWLRREVEVPGNRANTYLPLMLGTLCDFDTVYWNGKKIGETSAAKTTSMNPDLSATTNRRYDAPANLVHAGKNVVAIRLFSPGGHAGIRANRLEAGWGIPLSGPWKAKVEQTFPPLSPEAAAAYPVRPPQPVMDHYSATYLFNGMTQPLTALTLRGVLWYQGEANIGRANQYRTTFPLLIQDWRAHFHQSDLPFYFCQLSNYQAKQAQPSDSALAELRDAQTGALSLPHTGMAVLIDIGEEEDVHFRNKKDAGERLAAVALAKAYGQKVPCEGPTYQSAETQGGKIRLHFTHTEGGLVARALAATYQPKSSFPATKPLTPHLPDSELQEFAVCGDDHVWKWAQAKIEGDSVLVWSPEVPAPKFVRYAWSNDPTCNFYNKAGFPAPPFRTDTFPDTTAKNKY